MDRGESEENSRSITRSFSKWSSRSGNEVWLTLQGIQDEESVEQVEDFTGTVRVRGPQQRIYRRRTAVLKKGTLLVYKFNTLEQRKELRGSTVQYKPRQRKILITPKQGKECRIKISSKGLFWKWLEKIRQNRLYSLQNVLPAADQRKCKTMPVKQKETTSGGERKQKSMVSTIEQKRNTAKLHMQELDRILQELKNGQIEANGQKTGPETDKKFPLKTEGDIIPREKMDAFLLAAKGVVAALEDEFARTMLEKKRLTESMAKAYKEQPKNSKAKVAAMKEERARAGRAKSTIGIRKLEASEPKKECKEKNESGGDKKEVSESDSSQVDDTGESNSTEEDSSQQTQADVEITCSEPTIPVRRSTLPCPMKPAATLSVWKLLTGGFQTPIELFEPLGVLQLLCEELEYSHLLDEAASASDPLERMLLVAAFIVSGYTGTLGRASKPFNPLLGETFDCDRWEERGWRYYAEQVSHQPPVSACHSEGRAGWTYWQDVGGTFRLNVGTVEIFPDANIGLKFHQHNEQYHWNKLNSCLFNFASGEKRNICHFGNIVVQSSTGLQCHLKSPKVEKDHSFSGIVTSIQSQEECAKINGDLSKGFWSDQKCYFTPKPWPSDKHLYYGFGYFARELNEVIPEIQTEIPPTDSRLRPDQRLLEEGNQNAAKVKKAELEEKQRQRKLVREKNNEAYHPLWFSKFKERERNCWITNGTYWKAKSDQFRGINFPQLW